MGTMKVELLQTQHWLRGPRYAMHTIVITPPEEECSVIRMTFGIWPFQSKHIRTAGTTFSGVLAHFWVTRLRSETVVKFCFLK